MRVLIWLVLAVLLPLSVSAKDLYVNGATGNDATSYAANAASAPWRTIGRAAWGSTNRNAPNGAEAAKAGETVRIAAGTYTTTGTNYRFGPAYNPANSGTASAPIRFEGQGTVVLVYSSGVGPMIGADARHYIHWSGFTISESSAPSTSDTGQVVYLEANGGLIENCVLTGNPNWTARVGDNYSGVRVHGSIGAVIRNNVIRNYGGQSGDENHNGIETYWAPGLIVENNEIDNAGVGIYLKANFPQNIAGPQTVRFNVIHHSDGDGIRVFRSTYTAAAPLLIYQNISRHNRLAGVRIHQFGSGSASDEPQHAKVFNNTFYANSEGGLSTGGSYGNPPANSGHVLWNNITAGAGYGVVFEQNSTHFIKSKFDFDHNLYFGFSTFGWLNGADVNEGTWKSTGQDAGSVVANPQFVSATDYHLQASSPARTIGRARFGVGGADNTTIPAGAYITGSESIGPGGAAPPPPPPPPGPVDCVVSAWSFQSATEWSPSVCPASGQQTRTETWVRSILTPPSNGGAACPVLTETRAASRACTPPPPPPPPPPSGFDALIWAQSTLADGDLRLALKVSPTVTLPANQSLVTVTVNGVPTVGRVTGIAIGFYSDGAHRVYVRFDGVSTYVIRVQVN